MTIPMTPAKFDRWSARKTLSLAGATKAAHVRMWIASPNARREMPDAFERDRHEIEATISQDVFR